MLRTASSSVCSSVSDLIEHLWCAQAGLKLHVVCIVTHLVIKRLWRAQADLKPQKW